jgi:hypothetical protein
VPKVSPDGACLPGEYVKPAWRRKGRSRNFVRLPFGHVPGFAPVSVNRWDPETQTQGCYKRFLGKTPPVDEKILKELEQFTLSWCRKYVNPILQAPDFEEWLSGTSYNEQRKEELRQARLENHCLAPPRHVSRKVKQFVKLEAYPMMKHARLINSRCDRFKVWCGPLFKAIEERVYKSQSPVRFIKHVPIPERASLLSTMSRCMRVFGTDFTAYEKHFHSSIMQHIEFVLYRYMCPFLSHEERRLLFETLSGFNEIYSRGGLRARVKARRMSGEMCTSLGNGFTNMILALFLAEKKKGSINGFVEGDDGIFACDFEIKASDYRELGFEIKINEFSSVNVASFCGLIFSESGEIIRDPVTFLMKFGWASSFFDAKEKVHLELLRAKSLSCIYETPQCPIIGALARVCLDKTRGVVPRFIEDWYHRAPRDEMQIPPFCPSPDTRVLFQQLYHVDVPAQLLLEERILKGDLSLIPTFIPPPRDSLYYESRYVG